MGKFDKAFINAYEMHRQVFQPDPNLRIKLKEYYDEYNLKKYDIAVIIMTFYGKFTYEHEYIQQLPSYTIERCCKTIVNKLEDACAYFNIKIDKEQVLKELYIYHNTGRIKSHGLYTIPSVIFQKRKIMLIWLDKYLINTYGFNYHRFIQSVNLICRLYNIDSQNAKKTIRHQFKDYILQNRSLNMDFKYFNKLITYFIKEEPVI